MSSWVRTNPRPHATRRTLSPVTTLQTALDIIRWVHIPAGLIGLAVFWLPRVVKKSGRVHRRADWVFVYSTAIASVVAVAEALLKYETLDAQDVFKLMRGEPLGKPTVSEMLAAETRRAATAKAAAASTDQPPELPQGANPRPA